MLTLEKIAGYEPMDSVVEKVAEAMDYLEANGIDPIGGLTALMNIDPEGNPLDEKVASELQTLTPEELQVLNEVGEYLAGEDPQEIAKVALELEDEASKIEKVAEAMDYLEANGIDPEGALIIAANVTPEGTFADPEVEEKVAAEGFTDEDFMKIAEAVDYLAQNGIDLDEAYNTMALIKEAAPSENDVRAADRLLRAVGTAAKRRIKGAWHSYLAALKGKGAKVVKERVQDLEKSVNTLENIRNNGVVKNKDAFNKLYGQRKKQLQAATRSLRAIRMRQAKAIGGTALGLGAVGGGAYLATRKNK